MLKRLLISFLLLLAFAVVQAHDYIPHSHHVEQEDPFEHHDHDDDHDTDHDFLNHAFAHLQHEQGSAFSYEDSHKCHFNHKASFLKDYSSFLNAFFLTLFDKQQPVYLPPRYSVPLQRYLLFFDIPRRGPPAFNA